MATTTLLQNPTVSVGANDLTDQCTAATFTRVIEQLEKTSFGSTSRSYTAGLENSTVTVTLYQSFAATETYDYLKSIVGTSTNVVIKATSAATSATNPQFTLTGCYLESLPIITGSYGQLSTIDLSFVGGTYSVATS
jgi:hypothetical protein